MCSRAISRAGVSEMDCYMMSFCKMISLVLVPVHLTCIYMGMFKSVFFDYGPADAFWLFAFERLNGILGAVSTNHQAIEVQLMRKFFPINKCFSNLILNSTF